MTSKKPIYLTKSRFKIGHECATKLHYYDNGPYASSQQNDKFMKALADGGFQVGALAKIYYPDGVEILEKEHKQAAAKTRELLARENVVIFEAALMHGNLFVRVDILEKKGNHVRLIEVKAKSWRDGDSFTTAKGDKLDSNWEPYIADIAYQTHVARKAYPQYAYAPYLYLSDKDKAASVDGLHQRFFLRRVDAGCSEVEVLPGTGKADVGTPLLRLLPVELEIKLFTEQQFDGKSFEKYVEHLAEIAAQRKRVDSPVSRDCGGCEYRVDQVDPGEKDGFLECWTRATGLTAAKLEEPLIFDVWKLHYKKKESLLKAKRYLAREIERDDIDPEDEEDVLTMKQRQWLQVDFLKGQKKEPYFDAENFLHQWKRAECWKAPFHFIDFETITSAIPFTKGMHPYETVAFQFSHHVVDAEGNIDHRTQYINTTPGAFPNFDFVRALRKALGADDGTVFRYAAHENTVLNHIRLQLLASGEPDRQELVAFIETLTVRKEGKIEVHRGARAMVDLLDLVQKYYYSPLMGGSNSIKRVLPSVLAESRYLREKYSRPIYGDDHGIPSLNFRKQEWVTFNAEGEVLDPYKSLEPIFADFDPAEWSRLERVLADDEIREGGTASTAYARMQFTRMSPEERAHIERALLRYCELDTLAMVMIWEYWTQELLRKSDRAA